MSRNKGFTLIELLAVIVILAVIALIATPLIIRVINNARKGAAKSSALGYVDTVEKQIMLNQLNDKLEIADGEYNLPMDSKYKVSLKGSKPTGGSITITKGKVSSAVMCINSYTVIYDGKTATVGKECDGEVVNGATKVDARASDTHKGIVYLNPTNILAECNERNSTVGSGISGCMKWYIFDDSGDNYKMILDHDTENRVVWNNSNSNVAYESSGAYTSIQNLVSNNGWDSSLNTRLIKTSEINTITEKTGFNVNSYGWYYFDDPNKGQTQTANSQGASSYAWLYDYTVGCTSYGCDTATSGSGDFGYWTQDTRGTAGSGPHVWHVSRNGSLGYYSAINTDQGIRPVITLSKSKLA